LLSHRHTGQITNSIARATSSAKSADFFI